MAKEGKANAPASPQPVQSIEVDHNVKHEDEAEAASERDVPADGEDATAETSDDKVSNDLYKAFKNITETLLNFKIQLKSGEDYYPSGLFKRLPNKRILPEYYEVIKEPSAISTLRGKIQRKAYSGVPEFVRDFALVVHNAQIFNRPNSQPVRDILQLNEIFKDELRKLSKDGLVTEEDIEYPDLGEIPYATPEPDPVSEEEEGEEDVEEEEEDEEADESDEERRRKRGRQPGKAGQPAKKKDEEDEDEKAADAEQKRRGRPPKVATPMEHRIDRILKSLKKPKTADGASMILPFEKLPDKAEHPDYYKVILEPIAYDTLKKKAKRKKYASVDQLMKDIELMFKNARTFNEDGSDIYNFAEELLAEAKRVEAEELARPDSDYLQAADGRIPLPFITHKNDTWKVGDWVHLQNPNDVTKPIIAQIYRTWKTTEGEEWLNACWYYRPEQTVHQYEKHFWPNEVVKTGQYRDHRVEELVDKCFVMFYTRFNRGRPRGLREGAEVYVCEARYNEDKFKLNKIKTWASCLPDEVRDKDYEMDMFDTPRRIKKIPSPLKHLLKDDMKETDEMPQPQWGHPNAPPQVGGIHKHPREDNQSPPPEPTPPPAPAPPPVARPPIVSMTPISPQHQPAVERQSSTGIGSQSQISRPSTSMTPQPSSHQGTAVSAASKAYNRETNAQGTSHSGQVATPVQQTHAPAHINPYAAQSQSQSSSFGASHPGSYVSTNSSQAYGRPAVHNMQNSQYGAYTNLNSAVRRVPEAYVLSDAANESIPKEIRDQFPQDDKGRVLFFTQPPLDTHHIVTGSSLEESKHPLRHTDKHLDALTERKRKHAEETSPRPSSSSKNLLNGSSKVQDVPTDTISPLKRSKSNKVIESDLKITSENETRKIQQWFEKGTFNEAKSLYGDEWNERLPEDLNRSEERLAIERKRDRIAAERRQAFNEQSDSSRFALNKQGYMKNWQKDFFTGTYLDDRDPRLPF